MIKKITALLLVLMLAAAVPALGEGRYIWQQPQDAYYTSTLLTPESYPMIRLTSRASADLFSAPDPVVTFVCFPIPDGAAVSAFDMASARCLDVDEHIQYSYQLVTGMGQSEFLHDAAKENILLNESGLCAYIAPDKLRGYARISMDGQGRQGAVTIEVFMDRLDDMDLSALFGNMLDNALECVERIEDAPRRLVRLYVGGEKGFLRIRLENTCDWPVRFSDGLPLTDKPDKRQHGFGMKSMRRTVEKYGGSLVASQQDGWFILKILVPLPRKKTDKQEEGGE